MALVATCAGGWGLPAAEARADRPAAAWNRVSGQAVLSNGRLELIVETKAGINARSLRDTVGGQVYADGDYAWPGGGFPTLEGDPVISREQGGGRSLTFKGRLGPLRVEQRFLAPGREPGVILETITLRNPAGEALVTADFKCGFTRRIREGDAWLPEADFRICPVPYRRETNGKMQECPLREVAEHGTTFAGWESPQPTPIWGAEGWVWSRGSGTFLLAKHNPDSMEWSLLESARRGPETVIRFGGAGQWKHGHPEACARLEPGQSCRFGETRFQVIDGDWQEAFYAYRRYLEGKGCRTPKDYNPPVHWNELYDNEYFFKVVKVLDDQKLWWTAEFDVQNQKLLRQYYSLDLMLAEAAKARELGCGALYLDPGWDTGPNQHIWDAARLTPLDEFLKKMRQEYGLKVSLWTALGGVPPTYGDDKSCPPAARLVDRSGQATHLLCFASPAFLDTKERRLLELARQGVAFMMLDSDQYSGPCYDRAHGHQIPCSREDHARAILELVRRVKRQYPKVLFELHDPVSGPSGNHYTPTYYGYARPHSFDCLWGHEFMWGAMDDLRSKRAVSLYYYNLAYSIPLYLHVNLKQDNEEALVFWWFASTCRHLGVGGKAAPKVWEAQQRAMTRYRELSRFFQRGQFYGLGEEIHLHVLPGEKAFVVNAFNLSDQPRVIAGEISLARLGLDPKGRYASADGLGTVRDGRYAVSLELPPWSARVAHFRLGGAAPRRADQAIWRCNSLCLSQNFLQP